MCTPGLDVGKGLLTMPPAGVEYLPFLPSGDNDPCCPTTSYSQTAITQAYIYYIFVPEHCHSTSHSGLPLSLCEGVYYIDGTMGKRWGVGTCIYSPSSTNIIR